jgi:hypothetical protein
MKRLRLILSAGLLLLLASLSSYAQTNTPTDKAKATQPTLNDYVGRYLVDPDVVENFVIDIIMEHDAVWIKPSHIEKRKLVQKTPDNFVVEDMDIPVKFNRDEKGVVVSLTIQTPILFDGKEVTPHKLVLPAPSVKGNTTFTLKGYADARVVALAGTFNNWNQSQLLFAREGDEWVCRIDLAPGKYTYKFVVDGNWILDPANHQTEDDDRGFTNSLLVVKAK